MMSRAEMEAQLQEIMQQNELLLKENELFMTFLQRNGCLDDDEEPADLPVRGGKKKAKDKQSTTLTLSQRHELATKETEQLSGDLKELEKRTQREIDSLQAVIEETEIRCNEIRKEIYDFNRVLGGEENIRAKKFDADKIVKYFDDNIAHKESLLTKTLEKNAALRQQTAKVEAQLKQKEDQGDTLQSIDFHQLQIENNQYNQKIEERNQELIELKKTTGRTIQVLNAHKQELNDLLTEVEQLKTGTSERELTIAKLSDELAKAQSELDAVKKVNSKFHRQQASADMPQVLDYVNQKSREYERKAAVKNLERKLEIAEIAAKRARSLMREAQQMGMAVNLSASVDLSASATHNFASHTHH